MRFAATSRRRRSSRARTAKPQVRLRSPERGSRRQALGPAPARAAASADRRLPRRGGACRLLVGLQRDDRHGRRCSSPPTTFRPAAVLRPSDLRTAELAGDAGTMASLVPERELETVLGRELAAPVPQGAPLARASVAAAGSGPAAFTLVVPALRALGGSLRPGDRVTVLATFDSGAGAQARAIARGLRVLTVGEAPEGLDRASASIPVTVALSDPSLAAGLALANTEGKIDLLREGGKRPHGADPAGERAGRLVGVERLPVVLALTPVAERAVEHLLFGRGAVLEPRASAAEADELEREVPVRRGGGRAPLARSLRPHRRALRPRPGLRRPRRRSRQGLPGAAGATRARRRRGRRAGRLGGGVPRRAAWPGRRGGGGARALRSRRSCRPALPADEGSGSVLAVIGSKGAPGASECAASLAALAAERWPCVLVELDALGGGLDLRLGADPRQGSLLGLARAVAAGDGALGELLERWLTVREGWPPVLVGAARPGAGARRTRSPGRRGRARCARSPRSTRSSSPTSASCSPRETRQARPAASTGRRSWRRTPSCSSSARARSSCGRASTSSTRCSRSASRRSGCASSSTASAARERRRGARSSRSSPGSSPSAASRSTPGFPGTAAPSPAPSALGCRSPRARRRGPYARALSAAARRALPAGRSRPARAEAAARPAPAARGARGGAGGGASVAELTLEPAETVRAPPRARARRRGGEPGERGRPRADGGADRGDAPLLRGGGAQRASAAALRRGARPRSRPSSATSSSAWARSPSGCSPTRSRRSG